MNGELPGIHPTDIQVNVSNIDTVFPIYGNGLTLTKQYLDFAEMPIKQALESIVMAFPVDLREKYSAVRISLDEFTRSPEKRQQLIDEARDQGLLRDTTEPSDLAKVFSLITHPEIRHPEDQIILALPSAKSLFEYQEQHLLVYVNFQQRIKNNFGLIYSGAFIVGAGHSSVVIHATTPEAGDVAFKAYNKLFLDRDEALAQRDREIAMLQRLQGGAFPVFLPELLQQPHISDVFFPMTYIPGASIDTYVRNRKPKERGLVIPPIMQSVRGVVDYAHARGVTLRDINTVDNWLGNWGDDREVKMHLKRGFPVVCVDVGSAVDLTPESREVDATNLQKLEENLREIAK